MTTVERIPVQYRRPRQITPAEIWVSPEPSDLMVWELCPYIGQHDGTTDCRQCPAWEEIARYGKCKRGCRAMAEEACRIVTAVQRREAIDSTAQDRLPDPSMPR